MNGRPRTIGAHLPPRLSVDRGRFRYYRPDTKKNVSLPPATAAITIELAKLLNEAFGFEALRAGAGQRYRARFHSYAWHRADPAHVTLLSAAFPDLARHAPAAKQALTEAWLETPTEATAYKRKNRIRWRVDTDQPPRWVIELHRTTQRNAQKRQIPFQLSVVELLTLLEQSGGVCAVSGIALCHDAVTDGARYARRPWAPSIDRIDSSLGYTHANCRLVCVAANYAMHHWGEAVLVELAKGVARRKIRSGFPQVFRTYSADSPGKNTENVTL